MREAEAVYFSVPKGNLKPWQQTLNCLFPLTEVLYRQIVVKRFPSTYNSYL